MRCLTKTLKNCSGGRLRVHARNEAEGKKHCVPFWFWLQQVASRQPRTDVPMFGFLLPLPDPTCPPPKLKIARSFLVSLEPVLLYIDHGDLVLLTLLLLGEMKFLCVAGSSLHFVFFANFWLPFLANFGRLVSRLQRGRLLQVK